MKIKVVELDIADNAKSLSSLVGEHLCLEPLLMTTKKYFLYYGNLWELLLEQI